MNDSASENQRAQQWKFCSICKKPLEFGQKYYLCSVSTCQRKRTGLYFCSLACFEAHLPTARHRDAWAEEETAPSREEWLRELDEKVAAERAPKPVARRVVGQTNTETSKDVLVVVSKLKKFVKESSGMSTSDGTTGPLSDHLREVCNEAVRAAETDGRRTVLDRDIVTALARWRTPARH